MAENRIIDARSNILASMQTSDQTRREREAWAALAPASRRRYQSALRKLNRWTEQHAAGAASAPDLLCDFLEAEAAAGRINGLPIVLSALTFWQRAAGLPLTARDPMVRNCLRRLKRSAPSPRQAAALGAHELARIRETALQPRRGRLGRWEERLEVQLRAQVDVALCHLVSDAGLRRSEAARLEWSDFTEWDDGSGRLRIAPSKGHDEQVVYITPLTATYLRELRMMQGVLDEGAPEYGLMRPARTTGPGIKPFENRALIFRLSAAQIAKRIQQACDQAGLVGPYSGHSGRVGMAQRMVRAGAPLPAVQRQGRWKSPAMPARYTRNEDAGQAARWLA